MGDDEDELSLRDEAVVEQLCSIFCAMRMSERQELRLLPPILLSRLPVGSVEDLEVEYRSLLEFLGREEPVRRLVPHYSLTNFIVVLVACGG